MKRNLFLPFLLILFFFSVVFFNKIDQLGNFTDWRWPFSGEIASPLPQENRESFLIKKLAESDLRLTNLERNKGELVASISGTAVFFDLEGDIEMEVVSLQLILSRAKIEGKIPRQVDLRFSKPVVSY